MDQANCVTKDLGLLQFLKLKPRFFSQNRREPKPRFLAPDERFLRLDNRQDLKLRSNWDRRNNNDERAFLSAPFITSLISQSRGLHETSSVS